MRKVLVWIWPVFFLGSLLQAGDDKGKGKDDKASAPAQQYKALMDEFKKTRQELTKDYRQATNAEEKQKIQDKLEKLPQAYTGRLLELAQKNPKEDFALDALLFVVANSEKAAETDKAADALLKDHIGKVGDMLEELAPIGTPAIEKLLRGVLEKSSDHKVQASACLGLGQLLKSRSEGEGVKPQEAEKASKEAEAFLDRVVTKYADVKEAAATAKGELFEIRNLGIGKVAPDIAGEDGDAKKFKLSDYRGKVVVLDFWANW
jgi:hypothetical protein